MPPAPLPQPSDQVRPTTLLETDDDIRAALQTNKPAPPAEPAPVAPPPSTRQPRSSQPSSASPYRPTSRPPLAVLTVFDDGKSEGEMIRIRTVRFVIGRSEGDFLIPHDGLMSGRHVEITRQPVGGRFR